MTIDPPEVQVTAWWDLSGSSADFWTVGDPVRGALDEYGIAGDLETDITEFVQLGISITRGRSRITDEIQPGTALVPLDNHLRTFDPFNTASPYYPNIIPDKKFSIRVDGTTRFTGRVDDYDYSSAHGQPSTAIVNLKDSLAALGRAELDAYTPVAGTASEQINEALDRAEVAFGPARDIAGGVSSLGAYPVAQGTKVLPFAQLAARSELGRFFADRDDTLTFLDRHAVIPDSEATLTVFADDGTGLPFSEVGLAQGKDALFTRAVVSRVGGSIETTDETIAAGKFGQISTGDAYTDLLLADDEQSADMSEFLATVFSDPETRIASITVRLQSCQTVTDRAAVLALDIGALIQVTYTPDLVGIPIIRYCVIEGIRENIIRKTEINIQFLLGDVLQFGVWTIEDALLGALDSSPIAF